MAIYELSRPYQATTGAPTISLVDEEIFNRTYFTHCMRCNFCEDSCCSYGVDVDAPTVAKIREHSAELEKLTGLTSSLWFTGEWSDDAEFPGGRFTRTRIHEGRCVFLNRAGRGCLLHSYCNAHGLDYHELKPMVSSLYPITFDNGLLHASEEAASGGLVCLGAGPSLYRGVRAELEFYFGSLLVGELDRLERNLTSAKTQNS